MTGRLTPERAADALRDEILRGLHAPGDRLDEASLADTLGISRNTLRETFRLLAHERLVEHAPHRGVFVRRVSAAAARDSYEVRRHLECGAIEDAYLRLREARRALRRGPDADAESVVARWEAALTAAEAAVAKGEHAQAAGDWPAVGTANGDFHLALARLAGNSVLERTLHTLITEMRLRFLLLNDPRAVHEPFVAGNRRILELLQVEDGARALLALQQYLLSAQEKLATDGPLT